MTHSAKIVLIVWPKIPQMPPNLLAQFICPSSKVCDIIEKGFIGRPQSVGNTIHLKQKIWDWSPPIFLTYFPANSWSARLSFADDSASLAAYTTTTTTTAAVDPYHAAPHTAPCAAPVLSVCIASHYCPHLTSSLPWDPFPFISFQPLTYLTSYIPPLLVCNVNYKAVEGLGTI